MSRDFLIYFAACCQIAPAFFIFNRIHENKLKFEKESFEILLLVQAAFLNFVVGVLLTMAIRRNPEWLQPISTVAGFSAFAILALSTVKFFSSGSRIALVGVLIGFMEMVALFVASYL